MNLIYYHLLVLLFASKLVTIVVASDLEPYYYVNEDDPARGGCTKSQLAFLEDAYTEAIDMIRNAIEDIDYVLQPRDRTGDFDRKNHWDKTAELLIQVFDIHPHALGGIRDQRQRNRLTSVRGKKLPICR